MHKNTKQMELPAQGAGERAREGIYQILEKYFSGE